jgi:hypothetical protein
MSVPLPLCVYKYGGGGCSSGYAYSLSDALHSAHSRPTFCEHREWESRPLKSSSQSYTCACAGDQVFGERTRDCSLCPLDQH